MSFPHVCLYVCSCVHGTAEPLDGVEEWPDTQTSQQTDVNETYRVIHTIRYMGWDDFDLIVPPFCLAAQPLLPNSH